MSVTFARTKRKGKLARVNIGSAGAYIDANEAVEMAGWLLANLPTTAVLLLIASAIASRPELEAVIRAAGDIEDDNSNDGSGG